jgi:hypothetical protein
MTTDRPTQLGMVGLGRMGSNIVRRLMRDGHPCAVYDVSAEAVATLGGEGAKGADTIEAFAAALTPPRNVWVMVPAGGGGPAARGGGAAWARGRGPPPSAGRPPSPRCSSQAMR